MDTDQIFDFVIPDIIRGTLEWFDSRYAQRNGMRTFLDLSGFLGDYLVSPQALVVLKHSAGVTCPCGTFRSLNSYSTPKIEYTANIDSGHGLYTKSFDRSIFLRSSEVRANEASFLGTNERALFNTYRNEKWPFSNFRLELQKI